MRRKILALSLVVTVALGGCSAPLVEATPSPAATPTVTPVEAAKRPEFALPCYPAGGFHPITGANRLNLTLSPLLYRGLFRLDEQFKPVGELCREYAVSEDGLVWTFRLAAVSFSDGSPLTAKEVADSLNAARKSERYRERLANITKVAEEEATIVVTLSRPNGALPALLDVPIVKETDDPNRPLGTGVYYLRDEGEELKLQARAGAVTPLETISLRPVAASDDLIYAFDAGEIALVDTDLTSTNALGYSGRFETTDYATTALMYVGCNTKTGACRDPLVRRAVARCADREEMTRRLLAGHGVAAELPIHPVAAGYDAKTAAELHYNKEAAAALLTQAGWSLKEDVLTKGREQLTLKLIVNQDNTAKVKMAEELAGSLEALGAVVTLEKLPWDDFTAALRRGDFDLYLGETVLTADFDPEVLLTGTLNYGGFANEETARLLADYQAASREERQEAAALWENLAQTVPIIPLCFKNGSLLTQWGQVSGARPTQRDMFAGLENWKIAGS